MNESSPGDSYGQQVKNFTTVLSGLQERRINLGWGRLAVFAVTFFIAYQIFTVYGITGLLPTIAGLGLLLYLVSVDVANNAKISNVKTLIKINEEELQALDHQYTHREDGGHFMPAEHAYANDLDIFGKASIYQWLSRCYTEQGRQRLAENLLHPSATELILLRQEAVKELAPEIAWRQQWQAFSMQTTITANTERRIQTWAEEEEKHFINPAWKTVVIIYSIVTLGTAIAAIAGYIPGAIFSALFLLYLIISTVLSRNTSRSYNHLNGIVKETAALQNLVRWLEGKTFTSTHLHTLQGSIKAPTSSAAEEIKALKIILDRFDLRTSIVGILFFNSFLLWDVRQMIALNRWRQRNKAVLQKWFGAVAEMEVLHSISTLHFNHSDWCFPKFSSQHFIVDGKGAGHPLIPEMQRVNNDFTLQGTAKIGLITGSNMAGKSTFLRSLGVNIVLAQIGSPVCAASFLLSPVQLVSSMRIADNLAENTSTFYAELKKLRTIIEQVKAHQPVFILLDEILRGTNSYDRHKGSAALIKQLIKEEAVAVIATHDVELAGLETTYPQSIDNYHFDVEVEGEELYFDYKLKEGVCKSLNASILMKKIGIEIQE
ncbi:MAG: hypothetical protein JWR72_4156 [Flavisolibacter sp.]|nr:hypothetical protein [Flavisolibacter sp.]